jgi:hypothetical protein
VFSLFDIKEVRFRARSDGFTGALLQHFISPPSWKPG